MEEEGFPEERVKIFLFLDLRYLGQSYEITIPYKKQFIMDFHKAHQKLYSYDHSQREVEIVNIRVKTVGLSKKLKLKKFPLGDANTMRAFLKKQTVYYEGKKYGAPVFNRSLLLPGDKLSGPALAVDRESTTFLPPSFSLNVDGFLNLIIEEKEK